jgi:hypothetical protein
VGAEAAERPLARQRQLGRGAALGQVRRDVLAQAGLPAALQAHEVGAPVVPERGLALQALQRVALDDEGKLG